MGQDAIAVFAGGLRGPVGGNVKLSVVRVAEDQRLFEVELTRVAFPQRANLATEPFAYSFPRNWRFETLDFPLPWAPQLAYHGREDIPFAPGFDVRNRQSYHSLDWIWWLEGQPTIDADSLRSTLVTYFRGLSRERGTTYKFSPTLDKVSVTVRPAALPGGTTKYTGSAVIYDTHGELITLRFDVERQTLPRRRPHGPALRALAAAAGDTDLARSRVCPLDVPLSPSRRLRAQAAAAVGRRARPTWGAHQGPSRPAPRCRRFPVPESIAPSSHRWRRSRSRRRTAGRGR